MFTAPSSLALRMWAILLTLLLVVLAALTDWPANLFGLSTFWRDHALVAGALVSLLLLSSGYLILDVRLEHAREARDEACGRTIRELAKDDHQKFWVAGLDLGPTSQRRPLLLEDVPYIRETALATHRTLAVLAQLSMGLQSKEGMKMAEDAIHAFGGVGTFISELDKATLKLEMEKRLPNPETTRWSDEALKSVRAAHNIAFNGYADLLEAAGGESEIRKMDKETSPN